MVNKLNKKIIQFISITCLICIFIFNFFTTNVSAVGVTYPNTRWNVRQAGSNSWLGYTSAGENRLIASGTALDMLAYYTGGSTTYYQQFTAGKYYVFTSSLVFRFDYAGDQVVNPLPTFNCPILNNAGFSSISCDVATTVDVAATQHFITYVWTNVVRADVTYNNVTNLNFSFYMKNKSTLPGQLYVSGLTIGDSSQEPTTSAIQSLNSDLAARIQSLIDATNAFKSSFETWGIGIDRQLTAILNAIGSSGVTQQGIENAINNSLDEQEEKAEEQGQEAQDTTAQTQGQVDAKTQNLFSFITSFFGAFTSASPSNCNFDWGLADKGFGVIDMCQTNIPVELQSILSIVSILIVVPMVLWLINSIVGAFKEFQQ